MGLGLRGLGVERLGFREVCGWAFAVVQQTDQELRCILLPAVVECLDERPGHATRLIFAHGVHHGSQMALALRSRGCKLANQGWHAEDRLQRRVDEARSPQVMEADRWCSGSHVDNSSRGESYNTLSSSTCKESSLPEVGTVPDRRAH